MCFVINAFVFTPTGERPISHLPNNSKCRFRNFCFPYQYSNALYDYYIACVAGVRRGGKGERQTHEAREQTREDRVRRRMRILPPIPRSF